MPIAMEMPKSTVAAVCDRRLFRKLLNCRRSQTAATVTSDETQCGSELHECCYEEGFPTILPVQRSSESEITTAGCGFIWERLQISNSNRSAMRSRSENDALAMPELWCPVVWATM